METRDKVGFNFRHNTNRLLGLIVKGKRIKRGDGMEREMRQE
jgi:hypothetical protein